MLMQSTLILVVSFVVFLLCGVPISIGIGMSSILTAVISVPWDVLSYTAAQRCFSGIDSFALLAIPFFMLAGNIMNKGGIAARLVGLAKLVGGRLPGALAHANVIANMFFGSISGSSIAATAAIGGIMAPLEEKEGYDPAYSAAVNISSAPTGILIPPSGPLILYSLVSGGTSIAALFMAGYLPGILMGLSVMVVAYFYAKKMGYRVEKRSTGSEALKIVVDALPSLSMAIVVMGGILLGIFTPTEAAAIAVVYSLILAFAYKQITLSELPRIFADTMLSAATILFLIAASGIMSWIMAYTGIPQAISEMIMSVSNNRIVILLIMNIVLLFVGTFMDLTPAVLIFTPIFLPIATSLGIDPVHFGIIMIFNLGIGNVTPPVGSCLFVGCGVGKVTIEQVTKYLMPFFISLVVALMFVTYIPAISLFLPRLTGAMI